jgi:hypothetical protein
MSARVTGDRDGRSGRQITIIAGDGQATTIGNAVAIQPTVKVTDAFGT